MEESPARAAAPGRGHDHANCAHSPEHCRIIHEFDPTLDGVHLVTAVLGRFPATTYRLWPAHFRSLSSSPKAGHRGSGNEPRGRSSRFCHGCVPWVFRGFARHSCQGPSAHSRHGWQSHRRWRGDHCLDGWSRWQEEGEADRNPRRQQEGDLRKPGPGARTVSRRGRELNREE